MATLRTFQSEIEEIHHREVVKQRVQALVDKEKEKSKGKVKEDSTLASPTEFKKGTTTSPDGPALQEVEEQILSLLLSENQADHDRARDLVASLLTQHNGEYVLRIGQQPPRAELFSGELVEDIVGWTGLERTVKDIETVRERITKSVEEVGGKREVDNIRSADQRGRARVGLFRHKHEVETGRTSSVGMEILGFGPSGAPILPNTAHSTDPDVIRREKMGWEEISSQAAKIVSFTDLAGHERYLKTTLYGLTSGAPSCVVLMVGGNAGLIGMSKEHLAIALALSVPVVIDMTPPNVLAETVKQVVKILKSPGCRKIPVFVKSLEVAVEMATSFGTEKLCPIFQISNVTGQGLDFVRTFLNLLPSSERDAEKFAVDQPLEYSITEVWSVPYVGTVVNGILNSGTIKAGDAVMLGPDSNGNYQTTVVKSIQRKRADVGRAEAGQCVSLALKRIRRAAVRKGMVLVTKTDTPPRAIRQFEGQVLILYHNTTLQKNYQAMLHCGAVRQTVRIVGMDHPQGILRTGDRATVQFEFISHPEFVKEGMKLLFREGKTKPHLSGLFDTPTMESKFMLKRDSNDWSTLSDFDSAYPVGARSSLATISAKFYFSHDPRDWGSSISPDFIESDDEFYDLVPSEKRSWRPQNTLSLRGLGNAGCVIILITGLLLLFIGYPVLTFYDRTKFDTGGAFNVGGINSTGQIPLIGNFGLIDQDTPREAYTRPSWVSGQPDMQLVFSDEFNVDGRTFYPGDDPYWEAVDLHYWATNNLEWYDPEAITTQDGSLVITFSRKQTHGLNYEGGLLSTWNKFCFTGGYIETSVQLPGASHVAGFWPAIWAMGNLGRAGYGASLEGLPIAATINGDASKGGVLSYLPGQRLSRCTCSGESHPGPKHSDGTFVGRSAPEIDIFEAQSSGSGVGEVSQSAQWAPFDAGYLWNSTAENMIIVDLTISKLNTYIGSATQQATSVVTNTNSDCYELGTGCYSIYGFEYKPGIYSTFYILLLQELSARSVVI
ncbi:hypothetical protein NLJ89_g646 [Agrocybe chaxingu]|uniref:GH16 domain-containing protein n=1 Tax=Agrocybe chaxingu TaxID=84603 RepID=A0A9W8N1K4_9AGAR|nr:hypothetical protein NLJ89_g646 [Agrocybe chaxingu]